jgi:hypothetical protein
MNHEDVLRLFLEPAQDWVCDGYSADIRFLAGVAGETAEIWDASIFLAPLPPARNVSFSSDLNGFMLGQVQQITRRKSELLGVIENAIEGQIQLSNRKLVLPRNLPGDFYSEIAHRDRWFSDLHLQVIGMRRPPPSALELASIDNALRKSMPPFDGLSDAAGWLDLAAPASNGQSPSISIRVLPPVDLILEKSALQANRLTLTLHAHPKFDVDRIGLAIRGVPGNGLDSRIQASDQIKWGRVREERRVGVAKIDLDNSDSALAILMIGDAPVRRQWFVDPEKARNNRLLAVKHFDKDLKMIAQAVLESPDANRFEQGVAALLFLLGFSPAIQIETNSPDLIIMTPGGRLVIAECTTKIADFPTKIGKLVDRRGALSKALRASNHPDQVVAALICRLPRDQIAAHAEDLRTHKVILITGEELASSFNRLQAPIDPDKFLNEAVARLSVKPFS